MLKTHVEGALAIAILNRPEALNTLNLELAGELLAQLERWQRAPEIAVIFLQGEGTRAFCAGGDVKRVCLELAQYAEKYAVDFFTTEYRLDYSIHESLKPIVVVGHGYVMGGGIGLLAGATCRILTDSSALSMPELSIGLFADVGGSYFLNDLPGRLGLFLALTGTRLNATDAIFSGLGDFFIPDAKIAEFRAVLSKASWASSPDENRRQLKALTKNFSDQFCVQHPKAALSPRLEVINQTLAGDDPRAAFERLLQLKDHADPWLAQAAQSFAKGSPTSAFLIWEQLRRGADLSLGDCLRMELNLAVQCCRHHDFREGVRALLIDKDQSPKWDPPALADITAALIAEHFQRVW